MPRLSKLAGLFAPIGGKAHIRFNDATGGTITTFTSTGQAGTTTGRKYRVHTFSPGTSALVITAVVTGKTFDYLLVGGGSDGGYGLESQIYGGGGGGVLEHLGVTLTPGSKTVVCGAQGGFTSNGGNSTFNSETAYGGQSNGASGAPTAHSPGATYGPSGSQYRAGGGAGGDGSGGDIIPGTGAYYGPGLTKTMNGSSVAYGPGNYGGGGSSHPGVVMIRYEIAP